MGTERERIKSEWSDIKLNKEILDLDIEQLKTELYKEVIIHQNVGTGDAKPCNRGSCHFNIAFHNAAMRVKENKK